MKYEISEGRATMPKALTRKQIMDAWNKDDKYHDHYVCPHCRDLLYGNTANYVLFCDNGMCENKATYNVETGVEI